MRYYFVLAFLFWSMNLQSQLLAFPTAEGAGKFVSGGRGSRTIAPTVLEVTSLVDNVSAANTPGTFRYACTKSGFASRIIVFRVSGTIHLVGSLTLNRANTTIAGQTAPGEGICIADYPVVVSADNIIIRYMRFRLGDKNQAASLGNDDALGGLGVKKVIVDHCSISWSNDEACTFYSGDSLTLQWNLISEPLDYSFHDEGSGIQNHAYGGIWSGKHASFHHNLIAHARGRMPRFDGIRNIPADTGDFRNNVIYNWGDYNTNGGEGGCYNVVNNYYKYGPSTPNTLTSGVNRRNMLINPFKQTSPAIPFGKYYLNGNYCDNSSTITVDNWKGASFGSGSLADSATSKVNQPFNSINISMQSALEAYSSVLKYAGCVLPHRDTLDNRIVNDVINRTGKIIDVQGGFPAGTAYTVSQIAWPALMMGTAQTDSDHDGMPDNWELARGLNPNSNTDLNGYVSTSGYSNIENYINGDTISAPGKLESCINARPAYVSLNNSWNYLKDTLGSYHLSSSYTASTDSCRMVAAIFGGMDAGMFDASYFTTSTLRIDPVANKPYLNRNFSIQQSVPVVLTSPLRIRLYFSKNEFNALKAADPTIGTPADLAILRVSSSACLQSLTAQSYELVNLDNTAVFGTYQNGYYVEFSTSSLGNFFIAGKTSFSLPLKLVAFSAFENNNGALLKWQTVNESLINKYVIEQSNDGQLYQSVGTVYSKTNTTDNFYSFATKLAGCDKVFFRLKIFERDGSYFYSNVISLNRKCLNVRMEPNPVTDEFTIKFPVLANQALVKIFDSHGALYRTIAVPSGNSILHVNVTTLSPGLSILQFANGNGRIEYVKFLKR